MRDKTGDKDPGGAAQSAEPEAIFSGHEVAVPSLDDAPPQLYQAAAEVLKFLGEAEDSIGGG